MGQNSLLIGILITTVIGSFIYRHTRPITFLSDTCQFLRAARKIRRERRFPGVLDYNLMDAKEGVEWDYPPLLILIYALVPSSMIERHLRLFSIFSDLPCLLAIGGMGWLISGQLMTGMLAMVLYSCTPSIATQSVMLTARFLSITLATISLGLVYYFISTGDYWAIALAVVAGGLLLLSNALAIQAWILIVLSLAVMSPNRFVWLAYMAVTVIVCYLLAGRIAWRVHRGLAVKLWVLKKYRMDDIRISQFDLLLKIRGIAISSHQTARRNLRIIVRSFLFFDYPFIWVLPLAGIGAGSWSMLSDLQVWLGVLLICHLSIDSIPGLRFIGPAHRYLSYGFLPAGVIIAGILTEPGKGAIGIILLVAFLLAGLVIAVSRHLRLRNNYEVGDIALRELGECLKSLPAERIMALPMTVNEALGYFSEKKFLHGWASRAWGVGPRYGIYPVIERPITDIINQFGIEALVIKKDYVRIEELQIPCAQKVSDFDDFEVYMVSGRNNASIEDVNSGNVAAVGRVDKF